MSTFFSAWHYDGKSAVRRKVEIQTIGRNFFLLETQTRSGPFAFEHLHYVGEQAGASIYGIKEYDGWRLGLSGTIPPDLVDLLPRKRRYGGWIDRLGLGPASITFAIVSAAAVAVVVFSPQWLAPIIPSSVEKNLGDAMVGDFGGRFCHTDKGTAALKKLAKSLDPDAANLQVEVAKIDMINAVALPGGKVILFDGLVKTARSSDEVAGVLAHEIGHVRQRHVMQGLLRQLGLAVVLGGMDGSDGGLFGGVLSMSFGRGAENEADTHSMKALNTAAISPIATADFFQRLSRMDGSDQRKDDDGIAISGYLSSHPLSSERKRNFEKSLIKGKNYTPALTSAEWQELKTMCTQDLKAKSGFDFGF